MDIFGGMLMDIILRPYQENLKKKTKEAFTKYKRVILLAPCGRSEKPL